ncbi:amino acid:proton symporter, ABT family [Balnearium lithotrophicum]|uniref:Amino acid:proton symporter, ABT family n=1 Tax=Balnearium lithotrophicum TaxID=223788 RepID=A0A521B1K7_9BACT|nr:APC family permease [Balnearium lithotrophicum]SMO40660.1 amino acid:proton symporter, ABT family [Balnearium lithotrophicum]
MRRKIGFWEAYSIGVGGMIGGGIFAVLGLTILLSKGAAPVAFIFAGIIALITSYSYAKLSVRYPSEGGTVEFLVRGFGNNLFTAYLNTLLLVSYVIMLSLYSYAFGSYGSALIFGHEIALYKKLLIAGVIFFFALVNFLGAYVSGKAEDVMVFLKLGILLLFSGLGFLTGNFSKLSPENWESLLKIMVGGLIIFLAYEGFELIANTARDIKNPEKNLPRAFYASVLTVIFVYVLVSAVAVANLSYEEVVKYKDYALAVAAEPILGKFGFILIGIAALLSTASAINATLYGSARVSYLVAKFGVLPKNLTRKVWKEGTEGLLIISILSVFFAVTFNLENISIAGSFGFLSIFAAVNFANWRLRNYTDSIGSISLLGFILCLISGTVLIGYNIKTSPSSLESLTLVLLGTFIFELFYRTFTTVRLKPYIDWRLEEGERFIKNFEYFLTLFEKNLKHEFEDAEVKVEGNINKGKEKAGFVRLRLTSKTPNKLKKKLPDILRKSHIKSYHPIEVIVEDKGNENRVSN